MRDQSAQNKLHFGHQRSRFRERHVDAVCSVFTDVLKFMLPLAGTTFRKTLHLITSVVSRTPPAFTRARICRLMWTTEFGTNAAMSRSDILVCSCNLTLEEYDKVGNGSCINWNIYYNECRVMHKNPFQGSVSFDNIGFAWVAIFLVSVFRHALFNCFFVGDQFGRLDRYHVLRAR